MTLIHYLISFIVTIKDVSKSNVTIFDAGDYILYLAIVHLLIALIWATLFRDRINPFKKRFLFWVKNLLIRDVIPAIVNSCIYYQKIELLNDNNGKLTLFLVLTHIVIYIAAWL